MDGQSEKEEIDELLKSFKDFDPKGGLPAYQLPVAPLEIPGAPKGLSLYLGKGQYEFFQELELSANCLIAGAIGSGKTQFIYNQLAIWLGQKHPAELKLVICGSKPVDYDVFRPLYKHHLGVMTGPEGFEAVLDNLSRESARRLELFRTIGVRNISGYHQKLMNRQVGSEYVYLPELVAVIDDLYNFLNDTVTRSLCALMQTNTGTGIYIIAVTSQIASVRISPQLLGNFTFRAALRLMSQNESRKLLNQVGGEKLGRPGELFFLYHGRPVTSQQPLFEFNTVRKLIFAIAAQPGFAKAWSFPGPKAEEVPEYDPNQRDPLFAEAARLIVMHQQGSTSLIQRKMKLGYNRSGRIIDQLEAAGIIGPFEGGRARDVLYPDEYSLERYLEVLDSMAQDAIPNDLSKTPVPEKEKAASEQPISPGLKVPVKGFWQKVFRK